MREYELIKDYYGSKVAKRSGLPLMNHIDEGLHILDALGSGEEARQAFCLHPLVQDNVMTPEEISLRTKSPDVVLYTVQYAQVANAYLPKHFRSYKDKLPVIPNITVHFMLIADKVQNFKDFYRSFKNNKHLLTENSYHDLIHYFHNWFLHLGISPVSYVELVVDLPTNILPSLSQPVCPLRLGYNYAN